MKKDAWCGRSALNLPVYYAAVFTEADYQREMRKLKVPRANWDNWVKHDYSDATVHYINHINGSRCVLVALRVREGVTGVQIAALLVHEAVHIWQYCRELLGEDKPSSEFEAYSVQGIAQNLMQKYADFINPPRPDAGTN